MKKFKKLSLVLLLSISSTQLTRAMHEGPVEGPEGPASHGKPVHVMPSIPEGEFEGDEGEEGNKDESGKTGSSAAEHSSSTTGQKTGPEESGTKPNQVSDSGDHSAGGGLNMSGESSSVDPVTSDAQLLGRAPAKALELLGRSPEVREAQNEAKKSLLENTKQGFRNIGEWIKRQLETFRNLFRKNNEQLPEAEQVEPEDVRTASTAQVLREALNIEAERSEPMTKTEQEQYKKQWRQAFDQADLSPEARDALEKMLTDGVAKVVRAQRENFAAENEHSSDSALSSAADMFDKADQDAVREQRARDRAENDIAAEDAPSQAADMFDKAEKENAERSARDSITRSLLDRGFDKQDYKVLDSLLKNFAKKTPEQQQELLDTLNSWADGKRVEDDGSDDAALTNAPVNNMVAHARSVLRKQGYSVPEKEEVTAKKKPAKKSKR